ncbi:hypothetical protein KI809_02520 [Geobacter pelophilus]|uniref:Uncharacterized protein n=1 Tax=Geoanaerobacter pelophilus TaxID=60036 RepID=A0AAW4KXT8_9BACT|nr:MULTISPECIES: hypothetical protein [Geobacteraceae]MBT0663164.1 hypothetical protein [Geoanaerobacter pelophilus]GAM08418.1 hypothetical protein OR1_00689 [Geobacter sp. OR-1]
MNCPFPDEAMKTVVSYLRRSGQTVVYSEGSFVLNKGTPNLTVIGQAYANGAVSLTEDGSIQVCGVRIIAEMDTIKLRRKVEDHLRKSASKQDIIRIAACLGIRLK